METRDFTLKLKGLEDSGSFTGLASPYGDPADLYGDVIEQGAYKQAIAQQGKGYPLLWSHKQDEPLGLATISDSPAGLLVHGKLLMDDPNAQRVHRHLVAGSVKGVSIGFTVPQGEGKVAYRDDGARILKEIRLHELSVVAVPAAPRAQITTVKSLVDVRFALKSLGSDVDNDQLLELLEIDRELRRLLVGRDPAEAKAATLQALQELNAELRRLAA